MHRRAKSDPAGLNAPLPPIADNSPLTGPKRISIAYSAGKKGNKAAQEERLLNLLSLVGITIFVLLVWKFAAPPKSLTWEDMSEWSGIGGEAVQASTYRWQADMAPVHPAWKSFDRYHMGVQEEEEEEEEYEPDEILEDPRRFGFTTDDEQPVTYENPHDPSVSSKHGKGTRGKPDAKHLHGILIGKKSRGAQSLRLEPYVGHREETIEQKRKAHEGYKFNRHRSASLRQDRDVGDHRHPKCPRDYDEHTMGTASVVLIFKEEHLPTLLRTVTSILNHSPVGLLKEIIMVDDGGKGYHGGMGPKLKAQVVYYGEKLVMVDLPHSVGAIKARAAGAEMAEGDVLVFLDSHVEVTAGWLQPLLAHVRDRPNAVAIPLVDTIHADTFDYVPNPVKRLGFNWHLDHEHLHERIDDVKATPTPMMSGGIFAVRGDTWEGLGSYDHDMHGYGGEEFEFSLRAWMSGSRLDLVPCSRVGHLFRSDDYWGGQVSPIEAHEIRRNYLRAARVWMDDHATLVEALFPPQPAINPIGSIRRRAALRKRIGKHDFQWFLDEVYPELRPIPHWKHWGSFRNDNGLCLDTYDDPDREGERFRPGLFPCHGETSNQKFLLSTDGKLVVDASVGFATLRCVYIPKGQDSLSQKDCAPDEPGEWTYTKDHTIEHASGRCLMAHGDKNKPRKLIDCEHHLGHKSDGHASGLVRWHAVTGDYK